MKTYGSGQICRKKEDAEALNMNGEMAFCLTRNMRLNQVKILMEMREEP